jgi:hypothetical protein
MYSPNCIKKYIGSTTQSLNKRLNSHRSRNHPIFAFDDVQIRPILENVPDEELRKKEGEYIRKFQKDLFNTRVAGRTPKEKYWEDVEASREYHRNQYIPIKEGGDGNYRQLQRYKDNRETILRQTCIRNAKKQLRLPSQRSQDKYNFTKTEIDDIKKHITEIKENESSTPEDR